MNRYQSVPVKATNEPRAEASTLGEFPEDRLDMADVASMGRVDPAEETFLKEPPVRLSELQVFLDSAFRLSAPEKGVIVGSSLNSGELSAARGERGKRILFIAFDALSRAESRREKAGHVSVKCLREVRCQEARNVQNGGNDLGVEEAEVMGLIVFVVHPVPLALNRERAARVWTYQSISVLR